MLGGIEIEGRSADPPLEQERAELQDRIPIARRAVVEDCEIETRRRSR